MALKKYYIEILLIIILSLQVVLWSFTKDYKPNFTIVPNPPSKLSIKALSLGDEQFYFRSLAFRLQNIGDTFGRFTALKKYDYSKLYHWFKLLDSLDPKADFVASIAAYYYSQTQNTPDIKYVVNFLDEHSSRDLYNKWWWLSQAVYLANHKLENKKWALKLANKLASTPRDDIPLWAKQMPAFIHEQLGEEQEALAVIDYVMNNEKNIDQGEMNFMIYFIKDRLKFVKDKMKEKLKQLGQRRPELKPLIEKRLKELEDSGEL